MPKHILTQRASLKGLEKIGRGDLRVRNTSERKDFRATEWLYGVMAFI